MVFSDRNIEWMEWIGEIVITFLARNLQCNLDMYIILMFLVCHFHYWVAKCIKSDRYRSTAGWPHIQLSSLVQRQNFISALLDCQPGNEEVQNKNLPWEIFLLYFFFTKLCISLEKKTYQWKKFCLKAVIWMYLSPLPEKLFSLLFFHGFSSCQ